MALNTNPFIEGINPTATFGGYASVLLQLIRQAIPSSTYGMILFDTTAPDVTGSNAWRKTCVWLDLTLPDFPTVNVYKEGTSPGWVNTNNIISNGSITTAMIANGAVTLPKLSVSGGAALQLIRVNATNTAFEFINVASIITIGSIPVGSLITTGIPPGELRFAGVFGPTTANWIQPIQIINALVDGSINPDLIAPPAALTSRSQFLTARTADTFATYRYFEPNVDMLNATMNGSKLQDATVGPEKIYSAGVPDGYLMGKVAGVPDWVAPATVAGIVASKQVVQITPLPAANIPVNVITYAATGGRADIYQFYLVCITASYGHQPGDEVPLVSIGNDDTVNEAGPLIIFDTSASTVVHRGPLFYQIQDAALSTIQPLATAPERASWALKCVAIRFA
jgi:hypothetical protein